MIHILDDKKTVRITVKPWIYPMEAIFSCSYFYLREYYIKMDGDPEKELNIDIKPKQKTLEEEELKRLGDDFLNELISYNDYMQRSRDTKKIRETLLQRALFTNDPESFNTEKIEEMDEEEFNQIMKELEEGDGKKELDQISAPWQPKK